MAKILIVGSGASGVHFALSVLQKGCDVVMLDVGYTKGNPVEPKESVTQLKTTLNDPAEYFLGIDYEAVMYPGSTAEYYGFPPSKGYGFAKPPSFSVEANGFEPLFSFAQGGLGELWTGGVYPFNDNDLREFPFGYRDIEPYYNEVARRVGITGAKDDLARFFPFHENLIEPLSLDQHSQLLLATYETHKDYLNKVLRAFLGRARVATLSRPQDGRNACTYRGRCLWGCPVEALYTPSLTLRECQKYSTFSYLPSMYVSHFKFNAAGRIKTVVAESLKEKRTYEIPADYFILAAGTLSSSTIFMESVFRCTDVVAPLKGLMDNRQILIPFINLKMIGEQYNAESYQYHQLAIGIESKRTEEHLHGQITTLKSALIHPIIQKFPLDLRSSIFVFRNVRASLGVVNLNLHDTRREDNYVTLRRDKHSGPSTLVINYSAPRNERGAVRKAVRRVKRFLWRLGCVVPPGTIYIRPMGASVHYAGTLPMSKYKAPNTVSVDCRSHDFENLYIVDGSTFPRLPSKNLTFTLMANAIRVADRAF